MDLTRSRMLVYLWATRHLRAPSDGTPSYTFSNLLRRQLDATLTRRLLPSSEVNATLSAAHWALPARMWLSRVELSNEGYTSIIACESL